MATEPLLAAGALPDPELLADLAELQAIESIVEKRRWAVDPVAWAEERLGEEIWSGQAAIMESVRDNRKTAIQSCHEIGKSFIAARIAAWWLDTHAPGEAFVVTTAPTGRQVRAILWKEIGRAQAKGLAGRTNQTEWLMQVGSKEELVAFGFKPADYDPDAFQGIHAAFILVIIDEASGIPKGTLWDAIESLAANDTGRLLALGNPDDPLSYFHTICKPGSGWNTVQVGAFDTPAFTGEPVSESLLGHLIGRVYVEDRRKVWARDWRWVDEKGRETTVEKGRRCVPPPGASATATHPFWQSKVLGLFPSQSDQGALLPVAWVRAAQRRELEPGAPVELGVDVGGGSDSSTVALRRGPVVRIIHEDHEPDTMRTCGEMLGLLHKHGANQAKVDRIGIGAGIVDRSKELGKPVVGVNVGESAQDKEQFNNRRAELWWALRERFERAMNSATPAEESIDLDPDDEATAEELCSIRYWRTSNGKIQIEPKDAAKKRGVDSPNRADAVMLAFADVSEEQPARKPAGLLW